jgi:hypothetical protein
MHKFIIASVAALGMASTAAVAQSTQGGGESVSGPRGSVAGGATAGTAGNRDNAKKRDRGVRNERQRDNRPSASNSSSTYGSGTVYTDRQRATGGVTAGGTASGTGAQSSSTVIDAYGSTTRDGSTAEVYGDSVAESRRDRR